ncbi:hypothetical protein NZD88_14230 [Chryseobacterium antibioticum]|uniref:Uncharacterized protein n=1 Tax=Chryseobacterium pyrolae TaxID=2987481 RepID=A0ABT2IJ67_9FLAO|nr:hypothetical protein [Chryseobacterium pyrolae]MCT2408702.1 hypothetical protein [Chryseobacterium pyrolae]
MTTRKFTEKERNILYENIPLQKQGDEVSWETFVFIILNIVFSVLIFKTILYDYNPFLPGGDFSLWVSVIYIFIMLIPVIVIPFLLTNFILRKIRDIIVYSRYRKYAAEYAFDSDKIEIFQGKDEEDFIIQITNAKEEKIEIKIFLKITIEYAVQKDFQEEIGNYGKVGSEKVDIPFQEILRILSAKNFNRKADVRLKDFSTNVKLDSNKEMYYFRDFLKTKYNLVYAKKNKELLFINFYGDDIIQDIDIVVKDVEGKVEYYYDEDRLL